MNQFSSSETLTWLGARTAGPSCWGPSGSTGGAGLRGLDHGSGRPTPYQASVLYFDAETGRLQARDDIDLGGIGLTSAQVERHIEADPDRRIGEPEEEEDERATPSEESS